MKNLLYLPIAALIIFMQVTSCKKESNQKTTHLSVRMSDAPASYEEVNVDVREVRVNMTTDSSGWVTLPTRAGIYNLLALRNGVDTLLANGSVTRGTVREIRLVLGTNNTIKTGGITSSLSIPSGAESGLKLKLQKSLDSEDEDIEIDFDADASVSFENGGFVLRPVLRLK
jgi:hypothetical protein